MPKTCSAYRRSRSRSLSLWLGLALGLCFFQSFTAFQAFALEPNSPLFDQSTPSASSKVSQPLALPEESPNPSPCFFSTLVRLLFALALTIGLIFVTVWGLKVIWEKR